jgi:hypothetical protein
VRARSTKVPVLFILCGVGAVAGSFLPWASVSASFIDTVNKAGIDGDGRVTLLLGPFVLLLGLACLGRPAGAWRVLPVLGLALAAVITAIALINVVDVSSVVGPLNPEARVLLDTEVGVGLWLTLAAGMAGLAAGIMALWPSRTGG